MTATDETPLTHFVYDTGQEQDRYEGKLTFSPHTRHRFVAGYLGWTDDQFGYNFKLYRRIFGYIAEEKLFEL